jgi:pimeloyl-ACP methyl ester carboxylesterase
MDYRRLTCPVLIMRGERALAHSRMIAEALDGVLMDSTFAVVPGAGHMGPLADAKPVNALIAAHLTSIGAAVHDLPHAA